MITTIIRIRWCALPDCLVSLWSAVTVCWAFVDDTVVMTVADVSLLSSVSCMPWVTALQWGRWIVIFVSAVVWVGFPVMRNVTESACSMRCNESIDANNDRVRRCCVLAAMAAVSVVCSVVSVWVEIWRLLLQAIHRYVTDNIMIYRDLKDKEVVILFDFYLVISNKITIFVL